jgi:hypothetical protein
VKGLNVNLRLAIADGGKEHALSVGRKAETILATLPRFGEAVWLATSEGDDPDVRVLGVLGKRDIDGREGDPVSIGRDSEVANTLELHHVFKGERALLSNGGTRGKQEDGDEEATHDWFSRVEALSLSHGGAGCTGCSGYTGSQVQGFKVSKFQGFKVASNGKPASCTVRTARDGARAVLR